MSKELTPDLCVIGAGTGGLAVAAGAAAMGVQVVLVEKGEMGGCRLSIRLPTQALLNAAHAAHHARTHAIPGVRTADVEIDFPRIMAHVRASLRALEPEHSERRYRAMGVQIVRAAARFIAPDKVEAGGVVIRARRFIVATGAAPFIPAIPGLEQIRFLTSESVFALDTLPDRLVILGAGPAGVELAQAFARLGSRVTLVDQDRALAQEDVEFADVVTAALRRDGVEIREHAHVTSAEATAAGFALNLEDGARIEGAQLLVATGRRPNVEGLGLEAAGVRKMRDGALAGANLRTTNRRIHVIGAAAGGLQTSQAAAYHARLVLRAALFRLPVRATEESASRLLSTDPEFAACGLGEAEARARHGAVRVLRWPVAHHEKARIEGVVAGHAKLVVARNGRILGAAVAGPGAGELIGMWQVAVARRLKLSDMAALALPHPTLNEVAQRAALAGFRPGASRWLRVLLGVLRKLG